MLIPSLSPFQSRIKTMEELEVKAKPFLSSLRDTFQMDRAHSLCLFGYKCSVCYRLINQNIKENPVKWGA